MTTTQTPQDANEATIGAVPSHAGLCIGSKVRLLKSIWDDGEDHHPPGWLAMKGEVLIVRAHGRGLGGPIVVAHDGATGGFRILPDEYEMHNVPHEGAAAALSRTLPLDVVVGGEGGNDGNV